MNRFFTVSFLITATFFSCLLLPSTVWSNGESAAIIKEDRPMEMDADSIEFDNVTNTYHVEGNAIIRQNGTILRADEFFLDMGNGYTKALGRLRITDTMGNYITGSSIEMNMREKTATLVDGTLYFKKDNAYVRGALIRKTGAITYESDKTYITTCDCADDEVPTWSFSVKKVKIELEDYLSGRSVLFRIKNRPVFYIPYIRVPINTKRESGLLMPDFGYSELRGTKIDNAYFWAISDYMDATLFLDIETNRGAGQGLEFRGYRSNKSYTELFFYHFHEKDMDRVREFRSGEENLLRPASATHNRWEFKLHHNENFSNTFRIMSDIRIVSDDEYLLDLARDSKDRSLEGIESTLSITKNWKRASLVSEFRWFNNLTIEDDKTVLQRLPEVHFTVTGRKLLGSPLYFAMNSSAINFMRKSGVEGGRFDLQPRLSLPLMPGGLFELTPSVTPRWTGYILSSTDGDSSHNRFLYEFRTDAVTTLSRRFNTTGGLTHTIRPAIAYRYIPEEDQSSLPFFDDVDTVEAKNDIVYSLNMSLASIKGAGSLRARHEYLSLDLEESYNLSEERRDTAPGEKKRPFSEVSAELIIRPLTFLTLTSRGHFDVYHTYFADLVSTLSLLDKRGDRLNVTHSFDRSLDSRYIQGNASLQVVKTLALSYRQRYSLADERSLEKGYGLDYMHQCWGIVLTYTENLSEDIIFLTFSLKGIGDVLGFKVGN